MSDVAFYRPTSREDLFRVFTPWGYGEFQMIEILSGVMELENAKAVDLTGAETFLVHYPAVWEYACIIGVGGTSGPWDYFGGGHGNVSKISKTITVDGVDRTNAAPEVYFPGTTIVHTQNFNILLPSNNAVNCGTYQLKHTFTSDGVLVEVSLSPVLYTYEWYSAFTAMLPLGNLNKIKFGSNAVEEISNTVAPPVYYNLGSQETVFLATHTDHPYGIEMSLPCGGPNTVGSWLNGGTDCAYWVDQPGDQLAGGAKLYVIDISRDFALRKTAFNRSSATRYRIVKP